MTDRGKQETELLGAGGFIYNGRPDEQVDQVGQEDTKDHAGQSSHALLHECTRGGTPQVEVIRCFWSCFLVVGGGEDPRLEQDNGATSN